MYGGSVCAVAHYCFGVEPFGRPCRRSTAVAEWRDPGPPPGFRATLRYQVTRVGINSQRYSRSANCSRGASPRCNQITWRVASRTARTVKKCPILSGANSGNQGAVSSRKRNDCFVVGSVVERVGHEQFGRTFPAEGFSWTGIELPGDGVEF